MKGICTVTVLAVSLLLSCEKSAEPTTVDIIALKYQVEVPTDIPQTLSTPVSRQGYYHQAKGTAVYQDFHKSGWDECIIDFINEKKASQHTQESLPMKAAKHGYEQCSEQISSLVETHDETTVRRLLKKQHELKLSKK